MRRRPNSLWVAINSLLVLVLGLASGCSTQSAPNTHPIEITVSLKDGEVLGSDTDVTIQTRDGARVSSLRFETVWDYETLERTQDQHPDSPISDYPRSGAPTELMVALPGAGEYVFRVSNTSFGVPCGTCQCYYEATSIELLVKDGDHVVLPDGDEAGCS